ncbi:response regulator transcription factor [Mucilaginibacter sp. CAU 1740]|uniref:response regulator transcription factor n=1 Tax=Mucilaginibacter sp. CAU 1740 TaxID=3140365 RepID=UPI00325B7354
MEHRILIVEDDADLGNLVRRYLEVKGFGVTLITDGRTAMQELAIGSYAIAVLDVMLPGADGFVLASQIRQAYPSLPFLFLTARRQQADVLKGLSLGADDYMLKPFDVDELVLRIANILRRSGDREKPSQHYVLGDYHFHPQELSLELNGQRRLLTEKESALLEMLCREPGRLLRRTFVLESLWGSADFFNGRSLDVFIGRLRKLLAGDPRLELEVVRGAGFILHTGA